MNMIIQFDKRICQIVRIIVSECLRQKKFSSTTRQSIEDLSIGFPPPIHLSFFLGSIKGSR